VFLLATSAINHAGLLAGVLGLGFVIGVYGHIIRSRTLIITGIVVIAAVSLYFVAGYEVGSINQ
jgi:hypothetical protein